MKLIGWTVALLLAAVSPALAANCNSYPYTLQNGQTADANQVMSNFTQVRNCIINNAAASGANNDITSLSALVTPITVAQGGTGNTTGAPSGAAGGALTGTYPNPSLAFTPVQQGGGSGMGTNKVYIGWSSTQLTAQVDATFLGPFALLNTAQTWGAPQAFPVATTINSDPAMYLTNGGAASVTYGTGAPGTLAVGAIYLQTN